MLRQLHHKNIVQFYGANLEPGSMFFVTELMKGGDLYSALRHHPDTMRWDRLGKKVAHDTALGINYLHTRCASPLFLVSDNMLGHRDIMGTPPPPPPLSLQTPP